MTPSDFEPVKTEIYAGEWKHAEATPSSANVSPSLGQQITTASDEESDDGFSDTVWWTRFRLICKPEQSGKTAVMIRRILHEYEDQPSGRTAINFIFCANSLLLTKQTGGRLLEQIEGLGMCVEYSSQKGALKKTDEVLSKIAFFNVTNVVCPSNSCRVGKQSVSKNTYDCDGVIGIIDKLAMSFPDKYIYNIWMDEADKFTKPLVKFQELLKRNINASVWCITATLRSYLKNLERKTSSNFKTLPLQTTTDGKIIT